MILLHNKKLKITLQVRTNIKSAFFGLIIMF